MFEEGTVGDYAADEPNPLRAGLGIVSRHRDWEARASVHARRSVPERDTGATLAGSVRFSDHWQADAGFQSDSSATPVLALENGIDAWSVDTGVTYTVRSGHQYRLAAQRLDFSDGNTGTGLVFTGRQPLYADAPHAWALRERLETTTHDLQAVPYFSPERLSAAEVQLEYTGVLHALGPVRWTHTVTLGAGASEQAGFGSDLIGDLRWAHAWTPHDRLDLGAGIEWRRRAWDGDTENQR